MVHLPVLLACTEFYSHSVFICPGLLSIRPRLNRPLALPNVNHANWVYEAQLCQVEFTIDIRGDRRGEVQLAGQGRAQVCITGP